MGPGRVDWYASWGKVWSNHGFSRKESAADQILCTNFWEGSGSVLLLTQHVNCFKLTPLFGSVVTLDVCYLILPKKNICGLILPPKITCSESKKNKLPNHPPKVSVSRLIDDLCRPDSWGSLLGPNLYGVMGRTAAMNQRTGGAFIVLGWAVSVFCVSWMSWDWASTNFASKTSAKCGNFHQLEVETLEKTAGPTQLP